MLCFIFKLEEFFDYLFILQIALNTFYCDIGLQPNARKSRTDVQLNLALQTIEQISHLQGITPNQLSKLLDVAASRKLGITKEILQNCFLLRLTLHHSENYGKS